MQLKKRHRSTTSAIRLAVAIVVVLAARAFAGSPSKTLYKFKDGNDGGHPAAGLVFDAAGSLYGTTGFGGGQTCNENEPCGTVFKLTPNLDGSWKESVLYRFKGGSDGQNPAAGLIFDAVGNLYGTTPATVFELTPNSDGTWTESVLYSFCQLEKCADGDGSVASLIFDAAGSLYGTTFGGGSSSAGTVFKLVPNSDGTWTESVLHSFSGPDGADPAGGLIFDASGNLYGTTWSGGTGGGGIVFELTPNSDGSWKEHVLHAFKGEKDGSTPYASLTLDAAGNLYGTTYFGGAHKNGVVFKLDVSHKFSVIYAFNHDGANPYAGLTLDDAGNLYGATYAGGLADDGVVFKLAPKQGGGWTYSVLHNFEGAPGMNPEGTLVLDKAGHLYGTTFNCANGEKCRGTAFEVTP